MIRNDGDYTIYIIKHIFKDKENIGWHNTGDAHTFCLNCNEYQKNAFRQLQEPFNASGKCWQLTGIHGTFDSEDAFKFMHFLARINHGHRFGVFEIRIKQETTKIADGKYEYREYERNEK